VWIGVFCVWPIQQDSLKTSMWCGTPYLPSGVLNYLKSG
jgi:hypothetical protein